MMNNEQIKKIFADEVFVNELIALEDNAAFQAALKEKGIELTDEQVIVIRNLQAKAAAGKITEEQLKQMEAGDLPEELLEQVSGGVLIGLAWGLGFWAVAGGAIAIASSKKKSDYKVVHHEGGGCCVSGTW